MGPNSLKKEGHGAFRELLRGGTERLLEGPVVTAIETTGAAVRKVVRAGLSRPITRVPTLVAGLAMVAVGQVLVRTTNDPSKDPPRGQKIDQ